MNSITLEQTLPLVFATEGDKRASEVWLTSLCFERGKRYMIEAASGTGKSSLCAYLYGSRRDYQGRILFDNRDVRDLSVDQWQEVRRTNLAYLPQELSLFPELSAIQNIRLKNDLTHHVDEARIAAWLDALGIANRTDFPVGKMSIGQQQRVAIIRTLCQPFDFLLLDEPVSHLDAVNNEIAARIVEEEAQRQGAAIIATSVGNQIVIDNPQIIRL